MMDQFLPIIAWGGGQNASLRACHRAYCVLLSTINNCAIQHYCDYLKSVKSDQEVEMGKSRHLPCMFSALLAVLTNVASQSFIHSKTSLYGRGIPSCMPATYDQRVP
eukprot:6486519-Amphidinium_carterae.1